jgi:hypothetical protein
LERGHASIEYSLSQTPLADRANEIFQWIPPPLATEKEEEEEEQEVDIFDDMAPESSKRLRSRSTSHGQISRLSQSSAPLLSDETSLPQTTKSSSSAYKDVDYVNKLGGQGCFMHESSTGPVPEDIELCKQLLLLSQQQVTDTPPIQNTMFDDDCIGEFYKALQNRSESRILVDLHPLLMPCAENRHIKKSGENHKSLENIIDGYNDPWNQAICGPKPQPDHARGLREPTFSESQLRKLRGKRTKNNTATTSSPYAVRYDMYFPYLTAEVKSDSQFLKYADRANMHSMCIALRALVCLSQAAGCPEKVHRRILGFSISHDLEMVRIYGYYPEIDPQHQKTSYFRWPVAKFDIWQRENRWTCCRFVENLDWQFLPIHTGRVMVLLEEISSVAAEVDGVDLQIPGPRPGFSDGDLQTDLRTIIEKHPEEQKAIVERHLAQMEQQKQLILTQQEQQRLAEERHVAQLEQQKQLILAQQEQQRQSKEKRAAE